MKDTTISIGDLKIIDQKLLVLICETIREDKAWVVYEKLSEIFQKRADFIRTLDEINVSNHV